MSFYEEMAQTAFDMIEAYGQTVTLSKNSSTPTDASKPWRGNANTPTSTGAVAVLLDYSERELDGELVRRGDQKAYVGSVGVPDLKDYDFLTTANGSVFHIMNVMKLEPGGTTLLYELHLRR